FTLSAALTAFALANQTSWAAAPPSLMQTTADAVLANEAGAVPLSPSPVALAEDYLRRLWLAQLGTALVILVVLSLIGETTLTVMALRFGARPASGVGIIEPESFLPPGVPLGTPIGEQVLTVAFTPDAKRLVTAGAWSDLPGQLKIWDLET